MPADAQLGKALASSAILLIAWQYSWLPQVVEDGVDLGKGVLQEPPRHIALIPDGNRRWARERGLTPAEGHHAGIQALGPVAATAWGAGVEVVTFWWGSPNNLISRTPDEVANIIRVLGEWLSGPGIDLLASAGAELVIAGRWRELAADLIPAVDHAQQTLSHRASTSPRRMLMILMAYDGQEEVLAAAAAAGGGARAAFEASLWTSRAPPVDLVVRSAAAAEPHLSAGFMLWHIANAQFHWVDDFWPAVNARHIEVAIMRFRRTERRFGS
jgi:undecaprenyl diphosphate synthase